MKHLNFPFQTVPSSYREGRHQGSPRTLVKRHAVGKAKHAKPPARRTHKSRALVLGADTVVYFRGTVMGKPKSLAHARRMLAAMNGKKHSVYTGLALRDVATGKIWTGIERSDVTFKKLTSRQLDQYLKRIQPLDKAGAYAIQLKPFIVRKCEGSRSNVIGLPVELLRKMLKKISRGKN